MKLPSSAQRKGEKSTLISSGVNIQAVLMCICIYIYMYLRTSLIQVNKESKYTVGDIY